MNTDKLLGKLKEKRMTQEELCKNIGISPKSFYNKLKSGKFYSGEIERIVLALDLSHDEFMEFFFKNLVTSYVTK